MIRYSRDWCIISPKASWKRLVGWVKDNVMFPLTHGVFNAILNI